MSLHPPAPPRPPARPAARRGVTVRIGSATAPAERRQPTALALVGVVDEAWPRLADVAPAAMICASRLREGLSVERARLASRDSARWLPGLAQQSRLADAARVLLTGGAGAIDVLLARARGQRPEAVFAPEVLETLDPFFDELPGATLLFPDFAGPPDCGPGTAPPLEDRLRDGLGALPGLGRRFTDRTQVVLLDDPGAQTEAQRALLSGLIGLDIALCRFVGSEASLARHGWRSAAAAAAALLADPDPGRSLIGRSVPLPPGRAQPPSRRAALSLWAPAEAADALDDRALTLRLDPAEDKATAISEPTLRAPVGDWSLPALRTAKQIHRQVTEAAARFVFETVDDGQAIALSVALKRAVRDHVGRGVLVGPDGEGPPDIRGGTVRSPSEPGLFAVIAAWLKPWSQAVHIRVALRPGGAPTLEMQ